MSEDAGIQLIDEGLKVFGLFLLGTGGEFSGEGESAVNGDAEEDDEDGANEFVEGDQRSSCLSGSHPRAREKIAALLGHEGSEES